MALVEAVLSYKPNAIGGDGAVQIARTDDPEVLRVLQETLLKEALRDARAWREVDPGIAVIRKAEVDRLARILQFLLPEKDQHPRLRLIQTEDTK